MGSEKKGIWSLRKRISKKFLTKNVHEKEKGGGENEDIRDVPYLTSPREKKRQDGSIGSGNKNNQ